MAELLQSACVESARFLLIWDLDVPYQLASSLNLVLDFRLFLASQVVGNCRPLYPKVDGVVATPSTFDAEVLPSQRASRRLGLCAGVCIIWFCCQALPKFDNPDIREVMLNCIGFIANACINWSAGTPGPAAPLSRLSRSHVCRGPALKTSRLFLREGCLVELLGKVVRIRVCRDPGTLLA